MDHHVLKSGTAVVFSILSPMTKHYHSGLAESVAAHIADGADIAILDMGGIDFIDSTGINILLTCKKNTDSAGAVFSICGLSPRLSDILEKLNLHTIFNIQPTVEQALAVHSKSR